MIAVGEIRTAERRRAVREVRLAGVAVGADCPIQIAFQTVVRVAEAGAEVGPAQEIGLLVNEPETIPFEMVIAPIVVVHPNCLPVMVEGFVPPPVAVSGGEKSSLPLKEHVTCPGAAPENPVPEAAPAGVAASSAVPEMTIAPSATREPVI